MPAGGLAMAVPPVMCLRARWAVHGPLSLSLLSPLSPGLSILGPSTPPCRGPRGVVLAAAVGCLSSYTLALPRAVQMESPSALVGSSGLVLVPLVAHLLARCAVLDGPLSLSMLCPLLQGEVFWALLHHLEGALVGLC